MSSAAAAARINRFLYNRILGNFPGEISLAFAYGSGAFKQLGNASENNMLDFIFVVDDPKEWHRKNLQSNRHHYSALGILGPRTVANIQDRLGAGVYFNTLVKCEQRLIKYGVVKTSTLVQELIHWNNLYLSGRLHKPIHVIKRVQNSTLYNAMRRNQQSALYTSLLLLPERFSEEELFTTITGLSYSGDFRMIIGENKNKVSNIVKPNLSEFRKFYYSMLDTTEHIHWHKKSRTVEQDRSPACLFSHMSSLPRNLQFQVCRLAGSRSEDHLDVLRRVARDKEGSQYIQRGVQRIVATSSLSQSIKGIFTAGVTKTLRYSGQKLLKMQQGGAKLR
ncbi:phosphatidate cytidylyltransferase, mitochondrial-like [Diadema setosum]|uniref:phosphatidate cytidylyltransferase, mitochondrial-like n=1 Tax=Diadema setosum TaxID=31175 RepID=UPI003B3B3861